MDVWNRFRGVGVNIEKFRKKPELREIKRKELDIPPDGFHIVSVGELVENKIMQS